MKKLHLATTTDELRPAMKHIQVKEGFVYVTNAHILVKFPIDEVFGMGSGVTKTDHFYISGEQWKKFKFHTAYMFIYENGILTAKDKKYNEIAMIKTIDKNTFIDKIGKFPDCDMVITANYEKTAFDQISFDHNLYFNLCDIFNLPGTLFNMSFIGKYKPIYVKPNDESLSNAIALIMPVKFN